MKKNWLLCVSLLFFCGSFFAQDSNTLLWRIDGPDGGKPSYLFGTIHLPQRKFVEYTDSVYAAIQATKAFYTEIDFLNSSLLFDTSLIRFIEEKEKHFADLRKTEGWKRLIDRLNQKYGEKLDYDKPEQLLSFSQKFLSSTFEVEKGMTTPDIMLATHAMILGKKAGGLETYKLQMGMLYDIIDARMMDTSMAMEDEAILMEGMKQLYVKQQMDSLAQFIENINSSYRALVFDNRNITMADSIRKHMLEQPSFFAVGVGHLVGSRGLIALLRQKGFILTPVFSANKISLIVIADMMKQYEKNRKSKITSRKNEDAPEHVEETEDTRIDVIELPPPPPPPDLPKDSKIKPVAPKKKTNN